MRSLKTILGFEKIDSEKLKASSLDEEGLIKAIATLQTDIKWLKKGFWLIIATIIGTSVAL